MPDAAYFLNLALNGFVEGTIIALAALAISLVFGLARFPNAAAGDTATVGAYAGLGAQAWFGLPVVAASLAAMAVGAAVSVFFYLTVFRRLLDRSPIAALVASIGIAFVLRSVIIFFMGFEPHTLRMPLTRAISFGPLRIVPTDVYLAAAALVTLLAVFLLLHRTPVGRRMRAVADNRDLARVSGIEPRRIMLALWSMVGLITGLAGMLLGIKTVVMPEMGWDILLPAFSAAILGGIGSPAGAVFGSLLLGIAQELSTPFVGFTYKRGLAFLVLLLVLLLRPGGLFGRPEAVR
ncbi:MAG TPA: branched-chain amino acid ABC transporter permease [Rhodospirillales bacterium]|nr:branched-chain amino acid ABC transporter permease [Rhodospirillales bacterium]